jgi:hypothetical protein
LKMWITVIPDCKIMVFMRGGLKVLILHKFWHVLVKFLITGSVLSVKTLFKKTSYLVRVEWLILLLWVLKRLIKVQTYT